MKQNFSIVITQDEDGIYIANVVELPGYHTQAKDMKTVMERIKEAIELYLEVEKEKNKPSFINKFVELRQLEFAI